jgi:hypothetical protein
MMVTYPTMRPMPRDAHRSRQRVRGMLGSAPSRKRPSFSHGSALSPDGGPIAPVGVVEYCADDPTLVVDGPRRGLKPRHWGVGSVSVPPIAGHFTGSPVLKNGPRFPTASPLAFTALAQALVLGVVRPALPRTSVEATCQPPKHVDPAAHRPLHWIGGVEIRARAAYSVTTVVHHPRPGAGWPRRRRSA